MSRGWRRPGRAPRRAGWLVLAVVGGALADADTDARYDAARAAFEARDYARSTTLLEALSAARPEDDRVACLLGKSYGRQAEQAAWLEALRLARKTRRALERAVALNPDNAEAVDALAQYYAEAPGFLGGDPAKAAALREQLKSLPR